MMFADDDEVGKFDFQDYDDSNGDDYGDNNDDDEDDFFGEGKTCSVGGRWDDGSSCGGGGVAYRHHHLRHHHVTIITFILANFPLRCQVCHQGQTCHHHFCGFSPIAVIVLVIITVIS